MIGGGADVIIREIKFIAHVIHLNHPQINPTHLTWSVEKLSSMKLVSGVKTIGERYERQTPNRCLTCQLWNLFGLDQLLSKHFAQ